MAARMELETVSLKAYLFGRLPQRRPPAQVRPIGAAADQLHQRSNRCEHGLEESLHPGKQPAGPERQRCGVGGVEVRVKTEQESVLIEQLPKHVAASQRFEVDDLAGGEQILLLEHEARIGDDEIGAHDPPPA